MSTPKPREVDDNASPAPRTQSFRAINKSSPRRSASLAAASKISSMLEPPRIASILDRQTEPFPEETRAPDLPDREYTMRRALDRRDEEGRTKYLIEWEPSKILAKCIHRPATGLAYAMMGTRKCEIFRASLPQPSSEGDGDEVRVEWANSWEDAETLNNAPDAITMFEEFDAEEATREARRPVRAARADQPVLSTEKVTPAADASNGEEQYYAPPSRLPSAMIFAAEADADYADALVTLLERHLSGDLLQDKRPGIRALASRNFKRALVFRESYSLKGRTFNASKDKSQNAAFVYLFGEEQTTPCSRCSRDLGHWIKCVTVGPSMFNGACANCAADLEGTKCSHHKDYVEISTPRQPIKQGSRSSGNPSKSSTSAQKVSPSQSSSQTQGSSPLRIYSAEPPGQPGSPITDPGSSPPRFSAKHTGRSTPAQRSGTSKHEPRAPSALRTMSDQEIDDTFAEMLGSTSSKRKASEAAPDKTDNDESDPEEDDKDPVPDNQSQSSDYEDQSSPPTTARRSSKRRRTESQVPVKFEDIHSFRHPGCGQANNPCIDPDAGYILDIPSLGSSKPWGHVYRDKRFDEGEAKKDQVRYIISRCHCGFAQMFEDAWQSWLAHCREEGEEECYGSKWKHTSDIWSDELNEAVAMYCDPPPRWKVGSRDSPIELEED